MTLRVDVSCGLSKMSGARSECLDVSKSKDKVGALSGKQLHEDAGSEGVRGLWFSELTVESLVKLLKLPWLLSRVLVFPLFSEAAESVRLVLLRPPLSNMEIDLVLNVLEARWDRSRPLSIVSCEFVQLFQTTVINLSGW